MFSKSDSCYGPDIHFYHIFINNRTFTTDWFRVLMLTAWYRCASPFSKLEALNLRPKDDTAIQHSSTKDLKFMCTIPEQTLLLSIYVTRCPGSGSKRPMICLRAVSWLLIGFYFEIILRSWDNAPNVSSSCLVVGPLLRSRLTILVLLRNLLERRQWWDRIVSGWASWYVNAEPREYLWWSFRNRPLCPQNGRDGQVDLS